MRIRRRPPGQPLAYLLPIDPPQSPPPPRASIDHLQERRPPVPGNGELHLHPASATNDSAADLWVARSSSPLRRPALPPQDGAVEGLRGAQQQQQQGPADGRSISLENGLHRHVPELVTNQAGGEPLSNNNGVGAAVTTTATTGAEATTEQQQQQEETNDTSGGGGGTTRAPRGPGTLLEGSRCSRKNGRGWRCNQQTMVGYALCQYHLGKGRIKSGTPGRGRGRGRGPGQQLGRTEHANRTSYDAAVAPATAAEAEPNADVPPPPPPTTSV